MSSTHAVPIPGSYLPGVGILILWGIPLIIGTFILFMFPHLGLIPFFRARDKQGDSLALTVTPISNVEGLRSAGHTPDPGPNRYVFVADLNDRLFVNPLIAGIQFGEFVAEYNGRRGIVLKADSHHHFMILADNTVGNIGNVEIKFRTDALTVFGIKNIIFTDSYTAYTIGPITTTIFVKYNASTPFKRGFSK